MKNWMKKGLISAIVVSTMVVGAQAYDCAFVQRQTRTVSSDTLAIDKNGTIHTIFHFGLENSIKSTIAVAQTVAAGGMSTGAAIQTDNSLWTWGDNSCGITGQGSSAYSCEAKMILTNVISVSGGSAHMVAVRSDNTLWGWGSNIRGQLGTGNNEFASPQCIMTDVQAAAAGAFATVVIKTDGSLWTLDNSQQGAVKKMDNVIAACAGRDFYAAVKADHTLWTWGENGVGQLGDGTTENKIFPVYVTDNVAAVTAGMTGLTIMKLDGSVFVCGVYGSTEYGSTTPTRLIDQGIAISSGNTTCSVLQEDGSLYQWEFYNGNAGKLVALNIRLPERIRTVPSGWAAAEVEVAKSRGLVPDALDDQYQTAITREDFAHLAVRVLEQKSGKNVIQLATNAGTQLDYNKFTDCADADVVAVSALGIVTGNGKDQFSPEEKITREQAAAMLTRTAKVLGLTVPNGASVTFSDMARVSPWARESVSFISACQSGSNRVMGGTAQGLFSPLETFSKEQAVVAFNRLFEAVD